MRRLEAMGTYTDDEINPLARGGTQRGYIPGVSRVLPARATASPSTLAHESTLNSLHKKVDSMMNLFKSNSKYSYMFLQFESGGASGSGGCGDDEESVDDQDDKDEDGDGDTYFAGDYRWGKYPCRTSPTNIPPRQVARERFPQRLVAGESPKMSLGNVVNVVVSPFPLCLPYELAWSLTNSLDTRNHLKIHTTFLSGQSGRPYLCINKLAPSVGPSTRGYSEKERVMANTTPLVTTVMKPTSNPGEANAAPRVNIQELREEYYEDILPIIMEKARHARLKDVHTRLDFEEGPQEETRENFRYSNTRAKNTEP
uniref:Reverse transcriptase domain-containing protein n=1 Tax=Tanacetum cinerariifolium TaxID=118510 RepID=A0A699I5J8_TANCI|nr:hypothetical protein [Tanacetum cinerariifolium]